MDKTLIKAISWRVISTFITFTIVYIFTSKIDISIDIAIIDACVKFIAYYLHEKIMEKL